MGDNGEGDYHYRGKLGIWLSSQRSRKRGTCVRGNFTPQKEAKLQSLVDKGTMLD